MRVLSCLLLFMLLACCTEEIREDKLFKQRRIHQFSESVVRKNVDIKMDDLTLRGWRLTPAHPKYQMVWCLIPGAGHFPIWPDRDNPPPLGCLVAFLRAYGEPASP